MNPVRGCTHAASPSPPYSRETLSKGFPVGYPLPTAALISQATIYSLGEYFRITTVAPRPREPTPSALPFPLLELSSREPILCHFDQARAGLRLTYDYPSHWVSLSDSSLVHRPCCAKSSQIRPVRIMTVVVRPWQYTILYYVAPSVNPRATLADLCGGNTQWAWSYLLLPTYQVLMPISSYRDWEVIVK